MILRPLRRVLKDNSVLSKKLGPLRRVCNKLYALRGYEIDSIAVSVSLYKILRTRKLRFLFLDLCSCCISTMKIKDLLSIPIRDVRSIDAFSDDPELPTVREVLGHLVVVQEKLDKFARGDLFVILLISALSLFIKHVFSARTAIF